MATPEQVDEQCLQLLEGLSRLVRSGMEMNPREYRCNSKEKEYCRAAADKRSTLIHKVLSGLVSQLNLDRNAYAPISVLVDEVLVEIWSYLSTTDLFSVPMVCKRWRLVSLEASRLWTDIDFDRLKSGQIELLLKRAKNSLLHISIAGSRSIPISWKHHLQSRRTRISQMQSSYRGWCDRGVVRIGPSYALPSPAGLRPLLCQLPNPSSLTKEYDDEDSDYEYINSLPVQRSQRYTFPPSFFNSIVQRAKSLRATVGENASFYVTYKTLSQPMPSLWRLSLSKFPRSIPPPGFPTTPQPVLNEGDREYSTKPITWFGGITPNLRELDFAYIHAPWSDPIYSKLTYLRIYKPEIKLKLSQLLRILRACPSIEYLDLTECFIRPQSPQQTLVDDASKSLFRLDLPNLWYLHLQESIPASSPYLLAYITCPRLETLVLCSVDPSFIAGNVVAVDCGDFDYYSAQGSFKHAFEPLAHLLSRTTELHFTHSSVGQISVIGRTGDDGIPHIARWTHHDSTIKRVPGSGWSFSYAIAPQRPRPSPQLLQSQAARLRQMLQHQMELLQQLDVAGVHYHLIEKIDLGGNALYIDEFCEGLLSQCINLKRLRLRAVPLGLVGVSPPYASPDTRPFLSFSAMNILSIVIADRLNPQLEEVHVSWFAASASALADWVEMRAFKIKRLKKVVVDVYELVAQMMHSQPFALDDMGEESSKLDEESKMRIEAALEKREDYSEPLFIWRNPESERMMGAHAYYKETFGLNDHNLETNIETGS